MVRISQGKTKSQRETDRSSCVTLNVHDISNNLIALSRPL